MKYGDATTNGLDEDEDEIADANDDVDNEEDGECDGERSEGEEKQMLASSINETEPVISQ